jgi:predicted amino acid-binding ACT domain protein
MERSLRSRVKTGIMTDSEIQEFDDAQPDMFSQDVADNVEKESGGEIVNSADNSETDELTQLSGEVVDTSDGQARVEGERSDSSNYKVAKEQVAPTQDLLAIIWQTMQEKDKQEEARRKADQLAMQERDKQEEARRKSDQLAMQEREKREETRREADRLEKQEERKRQLEKELELERKQEALREQDRLDRKIERQEDLEKITELVSAKFRADMDRLDERIMKRVETQTGRINESVETLRVQSNQQILDVNARVESVNACVTQQLERLHETVHEEMLAMSESVDVKIHKVLSDNQKLKDKLSSELKDSTKQVVMQEIDVLKEQLHSENQSSVHSRLASVARDTTSQYNELTARINTLQDRLTEGSIRSINSAVPGVVTEDLTNSNAAGGVEGTSTVVNMVHGVNDCISRDNIRTDTNPFVSNYHNITETSAVMPAHSSSNVAGELMSVNRGTMQVQNYIVSDVTLPKFSNSSEENPIKFLSEMDGYFSLKSVPDALKLPIAFRAIRDSYVQQWVESVRADLSTYQEFKDALIGLLWGPSVQSQVRNSIYLDKFSKNSGESLSSHFLKYSGKAAYLTPKISDFDLVNAIAAHYPPHIGRALISANANTIQGALSFLRRIEALETGENGPGRSEPSTGAQRNQNHGQRQWNDRPQYNNNSMREGTHVRNVGVNRGAYAHHNNNRFNNATRGRGEPSRNWRDERGFVERGGTADRERNGRRLNADAPSYRRDNNVGSNTTTANAEN